MATSGQADIKTDYPVTEGLGAGQKHHDQENNLVADEDFTEHWGSI